MEFSFCIVLQCTEELLNTINTTNFYFIIILYLYGNVFQRLRGYPQAVKIRKTKIK